MNQMCKNCKYFSEVTEPKDNGEGICRRNPPVPITVGMGWVPVYIPVKTKDWCGEWAHERDKLSAYDIKLGGGH